MEKKLSQPQNPQSRFQPQKRLGQHFLKNRAVLAKIVAAADLKPRDLVLEIGPGQGALAQELAKGAGKVVAIEKDARLIPILKENLKEFKNVEVIQEDILKYKLRSTKDGLPTSDFRLRTSYKVVANLPYYAATHIIRQFLEAKHKPELMVLMVQKEVGQRICAKPPEMTLLAVAVQLYAQVKIVGYVSKKAFWPRPKVDGAIIKLKVKNEKRKANEERFFQIVKAGFSQPRKQILNNFVKKLNLTREKITAWLLKSGVRPEQRPSTLTLENWLDLAKGFKSSFPE
jgi:16S rRNA (adenine1518-N6/adenine1519-N6)-dimethyltransferase